MPTVRENSVSYFFLRSLIGLPLWLTVPLLAVCSQRISEIKRK